MRSDILAIVDSAVAGGVLGRSEVQALVRLEDYAPEAYYVHWGAHEVAWQASGGAGAIYAQIGMDAQPCSGGCHYCSFAKGSGSFKDRVVLPLVDVVSLCEELSGAGIHLISLMTTADYPLPQFLEIAKAARSRVRSEVALMANIGDFSPQEAAQLREAGIDTIYHAIRIGEGRITRLPEEHRRATIQAALDAGLRLMSGVDPVYEGQSEAELIARMMEVAAMKQICSGICQLRNVEGTLMSGAKRCTMPRYRLLGSVYRLLAGKSIPYGTENTRWCNFGTNPRGTVMFPGKESIRAQVAAARKDLQEAGWNCG